MKTEKQITGGLYLVADLRISGIVQKVRRALEGGVNVVQLWAISPHDAAAIRSIKTIAKAYDVPVLAYESVTAFRHFDLDGIHFDILPNGFDRKSMGEAIIGVTGTNDTQPIEHALTQRVDYVSFCAIYPSVSAISCEMVLPATIRSVRAKTKIPLFGSGGITPERVGECLGFGLDGIAVISGILAHDDPSEAAKEYRDAITSYHIPGPSKSNYNAY